MPESAEKILKGYGLEGAMKKGAVLLGAVLIALVLGVGAGYGATCPSVLELGAITGGGVGPGQVAVGPEGVYVTDALADKVVKYKRSGEFVTSRQESGPCYNAPPDTTCWNPTAIGVSPSGEVFVGNRPEDGSAGVVKVYDSSLNEVGVLGTVRTPMDVAADDELIYVVDGHRDTSVVKIYNAATPEREYLGQFGGHLRVPYLDPPQPGDLYKPVSVAINATNDTVVVVDRAWEATTDPYEPYISRAGAHLFTRDGVYIKTFVTYGDGTEIEKMNAPEGVAVDPVGRIYIVDTLGYDIHIFDADGTPLCTEYDGRPRLGGMDASGEGVVYLAAQAAGVLRYGVDGYVGMTVTSNPDPFDVSSDACGDPSATGGQVIIGNDGPGTLDWTIDSDVSWAVPAAGSGQITGAGSTAVDIGVDVTGLGAGEHVGTLTVRDQGATEYVTVRATVAEVPVMTVTGGPLSFTAENDVVTPSGAMLQVGFVNDPAGTAWSATDDSGWITTNAVGGPGDGMVDVSIDLTGLAGGSYTGHIMVDASCVSGAPAVVDVTLEYTVGGTIQVSTDPSNATYTITGPGGYTATGTGDAEHTGVEAGDYTIQYDALAGFVAPEDETKAVAAGEVTVFTGTYRDLRERNNVLVSIGALDRQNEPVVDEVGVYDENWTRRTVPVANETELYGEGTVTAAGDVDGDGVDEVIVSHADGVVSGYTNDGVKLGAWVDFHPFSYASGIDLAVGDVDGDGVDEIIAGAGKDADEAAVRVYKYDGITGVTDTGISFIAYAGSRGLKVAAGDVDGDGVDEILTAPRSSGKVPATVRVWKACGACPGGVADAGGFVSGVSLGDVDITAGDIDADGVDEIIVASKPARDKKAIATYTGSGVNLHEFTVEANTDYETSIAAGDTDYDGTAEIVCSDVDDGGMPMLMFFTADGTPLGEYPLSEDPNIERVNVSFGQVAGQ
jgi:hypothetical protein